MSEPLLEARGLEVEFDRRPVLRGVDLTLHAGETLALVGESGAGKSTLALTLLGLHRPARGTVRFRDGAVGARAMRRQVQAVLQDPAGSLDPRWRVARSIAEPLAALGIGDAASRDARVTELLAAVGLAPEIGARLPNALSGGQAQRVALARALAPAPSMLIADEPFAALDRATQAQVTSLLAELQQRTGVALLLVAHDLAIVRRVARRVAVLYLGRVVEQGATEDVLDAPLHPFTAALAAASRRPAALLLYGEPPAAIPTGCEFHPRCPIARTRCAVERPELVERAPGRRAACHYAGELRSSDVSS